MNKLKIVDMNGQQTIDSRLVAEALNMRHAHLLDKIKNYESILTSRKFGSLDFFVPSTYEDGKGETRACYMLTKKGCEMVANKMTGEKGVIFTAMYVDAFNEMQQQPQLPADPMKALELMFRAQKQFDGSLEHVSTRVESLENNMTITTSQQHTLNNVAKETVIKSMSGKNTQAYKLLSKKVFAAIWRDYKNYFEIPSYRDTLKSKYNLALDYLRTWRPDMNLAMEIDYENSQMKMDI